MHQISNLPPLSPRARKALDVLADGGHIRYGLEFNTYTRRQQFQARVVTAEGERIKGVGLSAFRELDRAGFLTRCPSSNSVATYYKMNTGAA